MPLNYKILKMCGTTDERLRELFTATTATLAKDCPSEHREKVEKDCKRRAEIEDILASRIDEAILHNLKTAHLHAAVDLAWDSSTITRQTIPLVMYAQKRISPEMCMNQLDQLQCKDQYVKYTEGKEAKIRLPKLTDVNINLVRSIITRRTAAQSARFTNLYPFFKYEPRGTSEEDKLRSDMMSQRMDIMADQYNYRSNQIQLIRDMLLYPHVVAFPASRWEREVEWFDENEITAEEFRSGKAKFKSRPKREGVPWVIPHPSRVFYDMAHPITSINADTGCEYFGFWDVVRYRTIKDNPAFFNRSEVCYGPENTSWFSQYSSYFSQYYTQINVPKCNDEISGSNDRKAQLDKYTAEMGDTSVYFIHKYWRMTPSEWGIGDYPFPIWVHLIIANSRTVVYAEIMPDTPGAVFSYNTSAQRLMNLSMAHDILPFQDQLTNLYSQLLECAKRDLFGIAMLNLDAFPTDNEEAQKALQNFRRAMASDDFFTAISILEVSLKKFADLGVDMDNVFKVVRQPPNTAIREIIDSITHTIMLAERVLALSPQEQAQLSPRETSATEVQVIAGTTENIYQFISDAIDEGRAAMKRYNYNAFISLGSDEVYLPVVSRYREQVVKKAGFEIVKPADSDLSNARQLTLRGTKRNLIGEYIFSSRDGADRASNIQAAQALTQMLGILLQPPILNLLTRDNLADIINTIIRQSGAGMDVMIESAPGEGAQPVLPPAQPQMAGAAPTTAPSEADALQTAQVQLPTQ